MKVIQVKEKPPLSNAGKKVPRGWLVARLNISSTEMLEAQRELWLLCIYSPGVLHTQKSGHILSSENRMPKLNGIELASSLGESPEDRVLRCYWANPENMHIPFADNPKPQGKTDDIRGN